MCSKLWAPPAAGTDRRRLPDERAGPWLAPLVKTIQIPFECGITVVEIDGIPSANDYVNSAGELRIRVAETARELQTPAGFTKLIDHVAVLVHQ